MNLSQIRKIQHLLGLGAQCMARLLGVKSGRTLRYWESGENEPNGSAIKLMRLLRDSKISPADLR